MWDFRCMQSLSFHHLYWIYSFLYFHISNEKKKEIEQRLEIKWVCTGSAMLTCISCRLGVYSLYNKWVGNIPISAGPICTYNLFATILGCIVAYQRRKISLSFLKDLSCNDRLRPVVVINGWTHALEYRVCVVPSPRIQP